MKRRIFLSLILILATGLIVAGCGGKEPATTSTALAATGTTGATTTNTAVPPVDTSLPSTSTTVSPFAVETVPPALMTGPFVEPRYLDAQAVDLAKIRNLESAALSAAQKDVLARQSFVASVKSPENGPWKFWQVYETARYQGLPTLVTTDSVLNAYHGLFDTLLQRMEEAALYDQARKMAQSLYLAAISQYGATTDGTVKDDAMRNVAYFIVGQSLLSGDTPTLQTPGIMGQPPAGLEPALQLAQAEVALIGEAGGMSKSPILGYTEDYSQYRPRGHYTRSEVLKRYFKGMMWFGHTAFFINPRDPDVPDELALSLTRRAILASSSIAGHANAAWTAVYEPTAFLVGKADDLTVEQVQTVVMEVFGTGQPRPDSLADPAKITTVRQELNKLPAPKILSAYLRAGGDTENREENERSFRVMGQRYIADSYAFQQLVRPYVTKASPDDKGPLQRDMPMSLDVMSVLGSDQAYKLGTEVYKQDQYDNWQSQIEKVNKEFAERKADLWPSNLYCGWLEALQHAMNFPADGAPDFMKSRVWARKSLNAALGSWTELRHDTILYAKQSVTAEGGGGEEPMPTGYVEPYPAFYAKIGELATTLRQGLLQYGLIDPEAASKLESMIFLADILRSASEKELAGQELGAEEKAVISEYGGYLEHMEQFSDSQEGRTMSPGAEKSPVVADVHTSANSKLALEEGTGYPLFLYAAFELNGKLQLFAGASYAYYEFTVPLSQRMTDEEWTGLLDSGKAPSRPAWTDEWIVEGQ